jgi:hypothetical protein
MTPPGGADWEGTAPLTDTASHRSDPSAGDGPANYVDPVAASTIAASADRDAFASAAPGSATLTVFAVMWAAATFFHMWVNTRSVDVFTHRDQLGISHVVAELAAAAVLLRPSSVRRLAVLAAVQLWTLWLELPLTGNHWVLAGLVDLGLLVACAGLVRPRRRIDPDRLAAWFAPVARWCLVGFYFFAAFSKVNASFFKPAVSCGSFFFDETVRSLGLGSLAGSRTGALAVAAVWMTVIVELSVPVLLSDRRFRHAGVVLGLLFHYGIALDRTHLFSDFSALLYALLVLFLPGGFAVWVLDRWRRFGAWLAARLGDPQAPRSLRWIVVGAVLTESLLLALPGSSLTGHLFSAGRQIAWLVYGAAVVALVVVYLRRVKPPTVARVFRLARWWLVVVPLLVLANGLTPYTELKTGFGWNMYANLRTVGGESNHLLVRRTLPLTDQQDELVRILDSNDPGLQFYATEKYDLAWLQLRIYLSHHPDVSVRYERGFTVRDLARASDDPALVAPVPLWQQKLVLYRAVDENADAVRCQPGFAPAR